MIYSDAVSERREIEYYCVATQNTAAGTKVIDKIAAEALRICQRERPMPL